MSSSHSRSQKSAYQVYSSTSTESSKSTKDKVSNKSDRRRHRREHVDFDSDRHKPSLQSLLTIPVDTGGARRNRMKSSKKQYAAPSLMEMDFSAPRSRHATFQHQGTEQGDWKKQSADMNRAVTDSRDGPRRRDWRESTYKGQSALIVEAGSRDKMEQSLLGPIPGSLFDLSSVEQSYRSQTQRRGHDASRGSRPFQQDVDAGPSLKKRRMSSSKVITEDIHDSAHQNSFRLTVHTGVKYTVVAIPACTRTLAVHGRVKVTPLLGSVSVLSCTLIKGQEYEVFSPLTGALLSVAIHEHSTLTAEDVRQELVKFSAVETDIQLDGFCATAVAVLLLEKLDSSLCDYLCSFPPYTQLFNAVPPREDPHHSGPPRGVTLTKLGTKISPPEEMVSHCLNLSEDYQRVLDKWTQKLSDKETSIILTCGAKNAGKSTFNRMLINTSLQRVEAVAYVELDVGQTEFSPPATLALHRLTEPVLEPPFCHQKPAERLVFYGDVTPSTEPSLYVRLIEYIMDAYRELCPTIPLIVNTMGFPEGLGLMLLVDAVRLVQPDLVVQIDIYNQAANLPAVTQEMVAMQPGWTHTPGDDAKEEVAKTKAHVLLLLMTLTSNRRDVSQKLKPVDLRHLSLLSHLSQGLEKGLTLSSQPPYLLAWATLGLHVASHTTTGGLANLGLLLAALEASVVALCVADLSQCDKADEESPYLFKEMPVCECVGLGIVRGVDRSKGLIYLVTTLPRSSLKKVNTLVKGSLTLPDQLILRQKIDAELPYVDALVSSTAMTPVRSRSHMPRVSL